MSGDGFAEVTESDNIGGGIHSSADSNGVVLPPQLRLRLLHLHIIALNWPEIGMALWSRTAESMKSMLQRVAMGRTLHHPGTERPPGTLHHPGAERPEGESNAQRPKQGKKKKQKKKKAKGKNSSKKQNSSKGKNRKADQPREERAHGPAYQNNNRRKGPNGQNNIEMIEMIDRKGSLGIVVVWIGGIVTIMNHCIGISVVTNPPTGLDTFRIETRLVTIGTKVGGLIGM